MKNGLIKTDGFTLIEVMIALSIFAFFITAFMTTQGMNIASSGLMREDLLLRDLTELKINEIIENPPDLRDNLILAPETKSFEDYPEYEYKIEYQKFLIPDLSKIKGNSEENQNEQDDLAVLQSRLFNTVKDNIEKMIWQVRVSVRNKETDYRFELSTWLLNKDAQVKLEGF